MQQHPGWYVGFGSRGGGGGGGPVLSSLSIARIASAPPKSTGNGRLVRELRGEEIRARGVDGGGARAQGSAAHARGKRTDGWEQLELALCFTHGERWSWELWRGGSAGWLTSLGRLLDGFALLMHGALEVLDPLEGLNQPVFDPEYFLVQQDVQRVLHLPGDLGGC